ncbi:unnamed protein product, partial [Iphiclides podalirius]
MSGIQFVKIENGTVTIKFQSGLEISFETIWLRDHCRCTTCYHADTFQRAQHLLNIPDSQIADMKFDNEHVYVTWDDKHESVYKADFLEQFDYKTWVSKRKSKALLWRGDEIEKKISKVPLNDFLHTKNGARDVFKSIRDYGIAMIENVEPTMKATEEVVTALGGVQHTMFGGMWFVYVKPEHADTAYTNIALAVHTDNTYFTEAAGLQIFHGMEHTNGTGGETILVDGFYGAKRLEVEFPDDYKFLTTFDVDAEFLEDGHHYNYTAPVIIVDKMNEIRQIRFNVYDRTPMAFSSREECRTYYRALKNLSKYYEDPSHQWQIKLQPGTVIAIDNFRVLHGRTSFTGDRVLCGSYVSRSDWLDKARNLQVTG